MITARIEKAQKVNGEWAAYLSFAYDSKILDIVRSFPSKWWHATDKEWEIPLEKLGKLVQQLPDEEFDISGAYVSLTRAEAKVPDGFEFKTKPFQHQVEAFEYGLRYDRWLLGDEMGLGKTKQAIDIAVAKKLQRGYKHCLIICGVNGLKWNWMNEIGIHSNETGYILGQRRNKIGSNADKLEDARTLDRNDNYFIITNVESLRNEDIVSTISAKCQDGTIGMIVTDEVHKMKNPSSQQGKGFLKLQAQTMIAMTGTPLMNNPMDLYIILKWLGYEKHAFYSFKQHYCVMGGYGGYEVIAYKNLDELQEQLDEIMLRRLQKDVLDLPDKLYITEYVDMTPKQEQLYKEIASDIGSNLDQIAMSSNPLAQLIRLRQATGYTGILSSKIQESAKLDRMEELVEEAVESKKQIIIFSNWTQMTDIIKKRLRKYSIGVITGDTKDHERQLLVDKFQNHEIQIMIGTIGAMGTGLTMTAATIEIFMDEPWNMALRTQAEDRAYRIGQKHNLQVHFLLCKNTIDERIHDIVYKKGLMAEAIVDGKEKISKRQLLEMLLQ